jgi:membrane protein
VPESRSARLLRRFRAALAVAAGRWLAPRTSLFAAALAFHALLALAPILLILLSIAAPLLGQEAARRALVEAALRFGGSGADHAAESFLDLVGTAHWRAGGTLLGLALMLYFASTFFARLRATLDAVWNVRPRGFARGLFDRLLSFVETVAVMAIAVVVLAFGALRAVVGPELERLGMAGAWAWMVWTHLGTLLMTFLVLAAAFRFVPSARPRPTPGAVVAGALPTALVLHAASDLIGRLISKSTLASLYGAAGSLVLVLLWVQYSAWIVLLGAEVSHAWDETGPSDLR